ncbi:MAG TPA: hypothetical protein VFI92_14320 [Steroidobacteraceae bacterium]|nr:hypothetical protein [Steroidobacteraceae bacterium]
MSTSRFPFAIAGAALLGLALAASGQPAQEHEHSHPADTALVSKLELDAGKPWPTDAPLRSGMAAIRTAFDADHPAIHEGRESDAQYEALAGRIEREVNSIVANCKLPAAADAQLHYVVGDLLQGVALMKGSDAGKSRHDGAARVHAALLAYGKYFDDPSWPREGSGPSHDH